MDFDVNREVKLYDPAKDEYYSFEDIIEVELLDGEKIVEFL